MRSAAARKPVSKSQRTRQGAALAGGRISSCVQGMGIGVSKESAAQSAASINSAGREAA